MKEITMFSVSFFLKPLSGGSMSPQMSKKSVVVAGSGKKVKRFNGSNVRAVATKKHFRPMQMRKPFWFGAAFYC